MTDQAAALFDGPGEMRARCRALDWAATPIGSVDDWSTSLRTAVRTLLAARIPMLLMWGEELSQICNDPFLPGLGESGRGLHLLGSGAKNFWSDIWETIGPRLLGVMAGHAIWFEDQYL
ncbi:MAG: hypothetical protein ABIT38_07500, partial [Gemmatimonadaceae bacterium]